MRRGRAWGWVLVALLATVGAGVWLLIADLLWVVPVPWLVLTTVLAVTAAPGLVPARPSRADRWAPVVTFVAAGIVGIWVGVGIAPSNRVLVGVLADVPVPAYADPIHRDGCRQCITFLDGPQPPRAWREIATDDSERLCREIVARAERAGWTLREERDQRLDPFDEQSAPGCQARSWDKSGPGMYLKRPAPFGSYGLTVVAYGPAPKNAARITSEGVKRTGPYVWLTMMAD